MKQELEIANYQTDNELEILDTTKEENVQTIVAGPGQCLIGGCTCTKMKGMSICSTCGHFYNDHQ